MLCGGSVAQGATPDGKAAHLACGDYNALSLMVVAGLGEWLLGSETSGGSWACLQSVTAAFSVNKVQCVIRHQ